MGKFKIVHSDASDCPVSDPEVENASSFVEVDQIVKRRPRCDQPQDRCPVKMRHVVVPRSGESLE